MRRKLLRKPGDYIVRLAIRLAVGELSVLALGLGLLGNIESWHTPQMWITITGRETGELVVVDLLLHTILYDLFSLWPSGLS